MMLDEYVELAQRTANTHTVADKIGHALLGLIGEAGELVDIVKKYTYMDMRREKAKEMLKLELGDMMWYLAELCVGTGIPLSGLWADAGMLSLRDEANLQDAVAEVSYEAVMLYRTRRVLNSPDLTRQAATMILAGVMRLAGRIGASMEEIMDLNIEKLRTRYGDRFDADKSNARYEA